MEVENTAACCFDVSQNASTFYLESADVHAPTIAGALEGCDPLIANAQEGFTPMVAGADELCAPVIAGVEEGCQSTGQSTATATAVVKLQNVYRSYRTRRRLADSAVVAEELWWVLTSLSYSHQWLLLSLRLFFFICGINLWWQAIDFARLNHSTVSFFNYSKPESATSKWNRVSLNASKVGKGLSKDAKALKLAFQHWIEAIDPRHRYGHHLHYYYDEWCKSDAGQPFFYWLDIGDGRNTDLTNCPRTLLREQVVKYLGPQERENYEYIISEGKITHKQTGELLDTTGESQKGKWIFVMSTYKKLYAGKKKKGMFHHSSFLAGGTTLAAGRLAAVNGILKSIWAYSGHYRPSEENLENFVSFLSENGVDQNGVQINSSYDEDYCEDKKQTPEEKAVGVPRVPTPPRLQKPTDMLKNLHVEITTAPEERLQVDALKGEYKRSLSGGLQSPIAEVPQNSILKRIKSKEKARSYQLGHQLSSPWSTGAGPRIGCVNDYPLELRMQALEFVSLSPRVPTPSSHRRFAFCASPIASVSPEC